jgi:hypothetical protein
MKERVFELDSFILIQFGILLIGVVVGIYFWHKILHW